MIHTKHLLITLATAALLASCSMMTDSRDDCPTCQTSLHVTLKYDYNMQRADMFNDHVGAVTCYLLDTNGRVLDQQTAQNDESQQPLKSTAFAFNFDDIDEGDYRLMAVAAQRPMNTDKAINPRLTTLSEGDNVTKMRFTTPRSKSPNTDGTHNTDNTAPLDTVWQALQTDAVHVTEGETTCDTLNLMRLTNNLNIMLAQLVNPTDNKADNYEVRIVDHNGLLNYDASQLADENLVYTPYAAWTTETIGETEDDDAADSDDGSSPTTPAAAKTRATGVTARTAHYDLSFGRLFHHPDNTADNARLQIFNKADGTKIVDIDLVYYLSLARTASERIYPIQEFLDREYDYRLNFVLAGNEWKYMTISISVLSWSLRIQNTAI